LGPLYVLIDDMDIPYGWVNWRGSGRQAKTENHTYKDVAFLLGKIPAEGSSVRKIKIPEGVDPGFLFSTRELIDISVEQYRDSP
jgi:hypothetical protein